ncbi:major tail protein [Mycobacterium phage Phillis]|nr:major tail protein [Mycobacterium phage Phillis]
MALNDDAVFTAAVGYVFTNAVGATAPTPALLKTIDLEDTSTWTGATGWDNVGHTSRNDMPEFGSEGGEKEMRGTWQRKRLREVETGDPLADYVTLFLHQFDEDALSLYYGPNGSSTPGIFGVTGDQVTNEKAFLIVIVDGEERLGFYAPKASVKRDDSLQLPVDDFAALPIRATFLDHGSADLYNWINEDLFNVPDPEGS